MNNTVLFPGGADAAIVRLRPQVRDLEGRGDLQISLSRTGVAATVDCNARYVYLHPYEGAKMAVAEAARNLSCVGAEPLAVTDNLNFGSPEKPIGYWQLAEACRGLAEACQEFSTPVTGGNVSLYNETLDADGNPQAIYPTPVVGMVGLVPDIHQTCGQGWQTEGDPIYLLGTPLTDSSLFSTGDISFGDATRTQIAPTLGGSEYLATLHHTVAGMPPIVDFDLERKVQAACRDGIRQGWVKSAHDCAEGGLAVALAECCISGDRGAEVRLEIASQIASQKDGTIARWDTLLFAEGGARILVSVSPDRVEAWEAYLTEQLAEQWQKLGVVTETGGRLRVSTTSNTELINATIEVMTDRWSNAIERRLNL
jgi:phosphoribosylformylglycinamidine synthase